MILTDRQLEIINVAGEILTSNGVNGLTTKKLAEKVGFSESALYRHFKSKEEIIVAMLNYLALNMDSRFAMAVAQDNSVTDKLKAIYIEQARFFKAHPHFVVAVFSDGLMEFSDEINKAFLKIMQTKMRYVLPIIVTGINQGVITNKVTSEELVHIITGTIRLTMFKWRVSGFQFDIEDRIMHVLTALLTLIEE